MPDVDNVSQDLLDLLMYDRVEAGQIPEEAFTSMLTACQDNPAFVETLKTLRQTGEAQFQALLLIGPQGLLAMTGMLAQAGVVTRKEISKECKIKTTPKKEKSWFKEIGETCIQAAYAAAQGKYQEDLEANRAKHGDIVPETLAEMLKASGASNLGVKVDAWDHPQTNKSCPTALVFRVDYNTNARNGVNDAKKAAEASAAEQAAE